MPRQSDGHRVSHDNRCRDIGFVGVLDGGSQSQLFREFEFGFVPYLEISIVSPDSMFSPAVDEPLACRAFYPVVGVAAATNLPQFAFILQVVFGVRLYFLYLFLCGLANNHARSNCLCAVTMAGNICPLFKNLPNPCNSKILICRYRFIAYLPAWEDAAARALFL
jgi:hypothetical protein